MTTSDKPTTEGTHFADWREQIKRHDESDADFLSYFDSADSVDQSFLQGAWDFSNQVLRPPVAPLIGEPFDATALEIGFGGGRLLAAASSHFNRVIGVDIHDSFGRVQQMLDDRGIKNAQLLKGDGKTLPVETNSIDFVYSFIVLQHLPLVDVLQSYLSEVKRVLKPGKPACLYFGYLPFNWHMKQYEDLDSRPVQSSRENTLLLRPTYAKKILGQAGLTIVETGRSTKKPWRRDLGEQHYAIVTA